MSRPWLSIISAAGLYIFAFHCGLWPFPAMAPTWQGGCFLRSGVARNVKKAMQRKLMKAMLLIKITFVTVIFLLLVMMGLYNRSTVDFNLPPLLNSEVQQPAALMYFGFFAVGLVTGAILSMGGHKEKSKPGKPS